MIPTLADLQALNMQENKEPYVAGMGPTEPVDWVFDRAMPEPNSGCWLWMQFRSKKGYGQTAGPNNQPMPAHRKVYELLRGKIPDGLTLDHLCRNPCCVNPDHLEPVTQRENTLRGTSPVAHFAQATHCANGHEFDKANTYWFPYKYGMRRYCRKCRQERRKKYPRSKYK